jgi:hypothetical protein
LADRRSQKKGRRLKERSTQTERSYLQKKSVRNKGRQTGDETEVEFEDDSGSLNALPVRRTSREVRVQDSPPRKVRSADWALAGDDRGSGGRASGPGHGKDLSTLAARLDDLETRIGQFSVGVSRPK